MTWAQLSSKISRLLRPLALACCLHVCAQPAHHPSGQALGTVPTTSTSPVHRAPWRWPPLLACHQQEGAASDSFPESGAHVTPGEASTTPHHLLSSQKPAKIRGTQNSQIFLPRQFLYIRMLPRLTQVPNREVSPFPQAIQILFHPLGLCSGPPPPGSLPSAEFLQCLFQVDLFGLCVPDPLTIDYFSKADFFSRAFASLPK